LYNIPEDAHKVGQNMLEFTVYLKQFQYTCVLIYIGPCIILIVEEYHPNPATPKQEHTTNVVIQ
jgi:hypothetical protein